MVILINCSNLKAGGGLQVAQSILEQLGRFNKHHFIAVISSYINDENLSNGKNIEVFRYDIRHSIKTVLLGRDVFLDNLVRKKNVDSVLTVFGPSLWRPRCKHLCGFARAQLLLKDSPYFNHISTKDRLIFHIWEWAFKRSSDVFYTENSYISRLLQDKFAKARVYTVTNYYHQIFDNPQKWQRNTVLPPFPGITCLSVSSYSVHKNFEIIEDIVGILHHKAPSLRVRFVLTFDGDEMDINEEAKGNVLFIGKQDISQIPYLYEQCDIMFMPTLLECFTATYPEAMRMGKPIVTTDLEFARGLCGNAACYYSALDADAAADAIIRVSTDKLYASQLVLNGKQQLNSYDNYEQRASKLIAVLEEITK